jgi:hypothetical protein
MLADFAMVIGVASIMGIWQIKQLLDVSLSHNNHKRDFRGMLHSLTLWVGLSQ